MYRFLATPKWIAFGLLMALLAAIMVGLGLWQLSRYHERTAVNARIDAAAHTAPRPVEQVLAVGAAPPAALGWTRITATGRYDPAHQILARDRTLDGTVGFEVLTPLLLTDGKALLVDRGWTAPARTGALTPPDIPAPTAGQVTVTGRVHLPESNATRAVRQGTTPEVRRISPVKLASDLPYPVFGGYLLLDSQQPQATGTLRPIPSDHQDALMNAGYVVQWWAFALLVVLGFGWAARRHAHGPDDFDLEAELDRAKLTEAPTSPAV